MGYSGQSLHQLSPLLQVNYRKEEAKILDSVMGATVYDSRIRPSGINGTGAFPFNKPSIANICHFKELSNVPIYNLKRQQEEEHNHLELVSLIQMQEIRLKR